MFPENKKAHQMKTRDPERFIIEKARTERFKRSPLNYMRMLLNQENRKKKKI